MVKDFSTRIDPLYQHTTVETAILGHSVYFFKIIKYYTTYTYKLAFILLEFLMLPLQKIVLL